MLEFYQAYANYHDLMNLTEELIQYRRHGGEWDDGDSPSTMLRLI